MDICWAWCLGILCRKKYIYLYMLGFYGFFLGDAGFVPNQCVLALNIECL